MEGRWDQHALLRENTDHFSFMVLSLKANRNVVYVRALTAQKKIIVPAKCNRPFPSCFEPGYERKASCKVLIMKISFHSYANKSFALCLAFAMRFKATLKWK